MATAVGHLQEALKTFSAVEASYEVARTHLTLACSERARKDQVAARAHLDAARQLFAALDVPRWVERTAALASELETSTGSSIA